MPALRIFICLLALPAAALADVGTDYCGSSLECASAPAVPVMLMVLPDGGGPAFTAAASTWGTVDATITARIVSEGAPLAAVPAEDIWLASADGGLAFCTGGTIADAPTDADGYTRWVRPLRAGGSSEADCMALIAGQVLCVAPVEVHFNSPDLNGDLRVDLSDVPLFARDYFGAYAARSDLHWDGSVNLADVVEMSRAIGSACP